MTPRSLPFALLMLTLGVSCATAADRPKTAAPSALYEEIAQVDRTMFAAFNAHDIEKLRTMFSQDFEMYHDTGGLLTYTDALGGMKSNFDKNNGLRRDLVPGSLEVYPINGYGAIEIGAHRFCHLENGKDDCGVFKFVHVWRKKDGQWQLTRAVSYDH